jgi:two-component system LytT family response regulator
MMFFFSKGMTDMLKILIIDSNTLFRKSLEKSLSSRFPAVEIQETGSGADGLQKVAAFAPQLIFIDIYLSDISGLNLAKKIKTYYPQIIIATFASFDSPEYQAAAAACGVEYLIPKDDWSSEKILEFVESVMTNSENAPNTPA